MKNEEGGVLLPPRKPTSCGGVVGSMLLGLLLVAIVTLWSVNGWA